MKSAKWLQFLMIVGTCIFVLAGCQPTEVTIVEVKTREISTPTLSIQSVEVTETTSPRVNLHTSFPTPTETPLTNLASPTAQATATTISIIAAPENIGRLFFQRYQDFGWYEILASTQQGLTVNDELGEVSSPELYEGIEQSKYLAFSHYSDQVAYWREGSSEELWVSDVVNPNPKNLLTDSEGSYVPEFEDPQGEVKIVWSPDDLHLFLYHLHQPELSRIFHLKTNESEVWYWNCDSIVLSSKSGRLATLCPRIASAASEEKEYAILEWGGEIWFSDDYPGEPFLETLPDGTRLWQWSSDGELLAYFDPNDVEGHLFIADKHGNNRKLLPGASLYLESKIEGYQQYEFLNGEFPILWAKDAPILLVNGFGQSDQPCPPLVSSYDPDLFEAIWPCWQAVDVNTGNIIWIETSLAKNLSLAENEHDPVNMAINGLAVEPGGRAIAVQSFYPEPRLVVVNLQTSEATTISRFDSFNHIYWAAPEN